MTYAIIEAGGKQLRVEPGRFYDVDRMAVEPEETVTLDQVFFVADGDDYLVGQPLVDGAKVSATVMSHLRGRKIIVYKMQPKKKTRKKRGHRQELTRIMIDSISVNNQVLGTTNEVTDEVVDTAAPVTETSVAEAPAVEEASAAVATADL